MTNTTNMTDVMETIDAYFAFLNELDAGRRSQIAGRAWAPDARYVDPNHDGQGRETLSALVEEVLTGYPGYTFHRTTGIDAHEGGARYGWEFRSPEGEAVVDGEDFAMFDDDGRIKLVVGFHGALPPL
jgi:hypothetical protein